MWLSYQMIHDFLKIPRNLANAQLLNGIFYESTKNYSHANFPTTVKSAKATHFKIQTNRLAYCRCCSFVSFSNSEMSREVA